MTVEYSLKRMMEVLTIQEIVTTNPNNPTTGSINLNRYNEDHGVQVKGNIMANAR